MYSLSSRDFFFSSFSKESGTSVNNAVVDLAKNFSFLRWGSRLKVLTIVTGINRLSINQIVIFRFDSFFVKSSDEKTQAYVDLEGPKYVLLKEGEYIEVRIKSETPPKSITAKIAVVNPTYL